MFTYPDPANKPNILEFRIGSELRADNVAIDILTHNDVLGLIPIVKKQVDDEIFITYDSGEALAGTVFFQTETSDAQAVAYLRSVAETLLNARRFMLETSCFVLEPESVYFDLTSTTAQLLYIPLKDQGSIDLRSALDGLADRLQRSSTAHLSALTQVRALLQPDVSFDLADFLKNVLTIQASSALPMNATSQGGVMPPGSLPVQAMPPATPAAIGAIQPGVGGNGLPVPLPSQQAPTAPAMTPASHFDSAPPAPPAPTQVGGVRVPPSQQFRPIAHPGNRETSAAPIESADKPMSIFYLMAHYSGENKRRYDEQRAARRAAKENGSTNQPIKGNPSGIATPSGVAPGSPTIVAGMSLKDQQQTGAMPPPTNTGPYAQSAVASPTLGIYGLGNNPAEDFGQTVMFGQEAAGQAPGVAPVIAVPVPAGQVDASGQPSTPSQSPGLAPYVPASPAIPINDASNIPELPKSPPRHATEITAMITRKATGESIPITKPEFVIGRKADNADLILSDRTVSKQHAIIFYEATGWSIQDRGATNGVFIDGRTIEPGVRVPIGSGATILLGDEELLFTIS